MRSPQLLLIETPAPLFSTSFTTSPEGSRFRLDDRTRTIGREGLAAARAALAEVAARRAEQAEMLSDRQAA
jgi:hypothetical protein